MPEQYEGTCSMEITLTVTGVDWHTEQTEEKSDTSLRTIIEQEASGDIKYIDDIPKGSDNQVVSVKVTAFEKTAHYGPDGEGE